MNGKLIILGAGGHGNVAADCAHEMGCWKDIVFLDDRHEVADERNRWPIIGPLESVFTLTDKHDEVFVAIGNGNARDEWVQRLLGARLKVATLIHPKAIVSQFCSIGEGTMVVAGACVNIGAKIDMGCIVNTGATVDHDCVLGLCVHVCPGANIAGNVRIGRQSWIGIGSCIKQDIRIGENVTVGAGSVVIRDIGPGQTVAGSPALPIGGSVC